MKKIFLFLLIAVALRAQYTTPNTGAAWNLDSLVVYSGGAVTGSLPNYTINNKIIVSANDLVAIFPGTIVNFVGTTSGIEVNGRLKILGSNLAGVTFTSSTQDSLGAYEGLRFNDTSIDTECVINYARIEYAYYGVRAVNASPFVANSVFYKCRRGFNLSGSDAKILANAIQWSYEYGITMTLGSNPLIAGNYLLGNNTQNTSAKNQISIGLQGNNSPIIKNNVIQGSTANIKTGGISLWVSGASAFSDAVIENNAIFDNIFGVTLLSSSNGIINALVKGNHIHNNKHNPDPMTSGSGINVNGSAFNKPIIARNKIHDNWWGITIQNGSIVQEGPQPIIGNVENTDTSDDGYNEIYNNIQAGGVFDLYNNCTNNILAQNNDWGVYDSTSIENHIYHKNDNSAHGQVFFMPFFDPSQIPVEMISFAACLINNEVKLNWSTASELNNKGFEVQRSVVSGQRTKNAASDSWTLNAERWTKIGFVTGVGTTADQQNYIFTDENVSIGKYFYRLKQIDFNGSFSFSNEIEVDVELPDGFSLEQNYPNPFNPSTVIKYAVGNASAPLSANGSKQLVTLKVFDILGKEVATLVNEEKEPGVYNSQFSILHSQFPSGVYFYQLRAGEFVASKKFVLLK